MGEMAKLLKSGDVNIYFDSPCPALTAMHRSGAKPFLRRWKNGIASYYTEIFVRKDSGIEKLEDLKGKVIAFEDPYSTSSYFLPKSILTGAGIKMTQKTNFASSVAPDEVEDNPGEVR